VQLKLDFSPKAIASGKKIERIPIACSYDLKKLLEQIASKQNLSVSQIGHRYLIEGLQRDIGTLYFSEPYQDETLGSLLQKKF